MAENKMDKVISLCVRRGLILPNSEIYGTLAGFFDYGPYGVELKNNLQNNWWRNFVQQRDDVVGLDGAIITHPSVWKASGHVDAFNDPLVDCKKCKQRFRADHLLEDELKISVDGFSLEKIGGLIAEKKIACPKCKGELTPARVFNLMFKTHIGPVEDESAIAYLRPETAQLIFTQFKAIALSSRKKLPFGIAQIGKAFRNEISPRNFVFRCREFSQMEIEYFIHPKKLDECPFFEEIKDVTLPLYTAEMQAKNAKENKEMTCGEAVEKKIIGTKWHAYWLAKCLEWFESIGVKKENLRLRQHVKTELSHYSSETWDVEYHYEWGWKELQGIANRGNFDLTQHQKVSGKEMTIFDEETKEKVIPFVIEPSAGVDRAILTVLMDAFEEKTENGETKTVLHLSPKIAPVKIGVFPLMKKDGLAEKGREVHKLLKESWAVEYDESGSIGKRYARHDEIGTPFCITIDYDTLKDDTVTVRERDSAKQERVKISGLKALFTEKL